MESGCSDLGRDARQKCPEKCPSKVNVDQAEMPCFYEGAGNRARTDDLLITNQLLYQLSYAGKTSRP